LNLKNAWHLKSLDIDRGIGILPMGTWAGSPCHFSPVQPRDKPGLSAIYEMARMAQAVRNLLYNEVDQE
jgi:hypothetical protein